MAVLGCGCLNKIIDQPQGILFVPQVAERVVPIRLLQIHQIEYPDVIALAFQPAAGGQQDLRFWICNYIVGICLQHIGFYIASSFGRSTPANDQHI